MRRGFGRLIALPIAFFVVSATPGERLIPLPRGEGEALVIPSDTPVRFQRFGEEDTAYFKGRFLLTGTFRLECDFCEQSGKEDDLGLYVVPDDSIMRRLPHWKTRQDNRIFIRGEARLIRSLGGRKERLEIATGKRDDIHGRMAIVVDDFRLGIECDGAVLSAHYVALARPPQLAKTKGSNDGYC